MPSFTASRPWANAPRLGLGPSVFRWKGITEIGRSRVSPEKLLTKRLIHQTTPDFCLDAVARFEFEAELIYDGINWRILMSTSAFVDAKVYAFDADNNQVGYIWAEKAYDTKDDPDQARFEAMAIGSRAQIIERIFRVACNIPGGVTKVRHKTPRHFIDAMMNKLNKPLQWGQSTEVVLSTKHGSLGPSITNRNIDEVVLALQKHGMQEHADIHLLQKHDVSIDMAKNLQLIDELTRYPHGIQAWKLTESHRLPWSAVEYQHGPKMQADPLATKAAKRTAVRPEVQMIQTPLWSGYSWLWVCKVQDAADAPPSFSKVGPAWVLHANVIQHAGRMEAEQPGYYVHALESFDRALNSTDRSDWPETIAQTFSIDASTASAEQKDRVLEMSMLLYAEPRTTINPTSHDLCRAIGGIADEEKKARAWYACTCVITDENLTQIEFGPSKRIYERDGSAPRPRG
jgi:hypothetical protein